MYYWAPVNNATIYIAMFLRYLVLMNVSLAVFNLIPVPPLDGSRILLVVLPQRIYFGLMRYEKIYHDRHAGSGVGRLSGYAALLPEQRSVVASGRRHRVY